MKKKLLLPKNCDNKLMRVIFIMLFIIGSAINGYSQTIMSYQSAMQTLEPSAAAHLQSLVTDLHPSVYLTQGEITTYGEGAPLVAICDAASISLLYGDNPVLNQVELINITANSAAELPTSIDLTQLQGLAELKYLFIVFAYDECGDSSDDCLATKIEGIIQGTSAQITVIYNLSIPQ